MRGLFKFIGYLLLLSIILLVVAGAYLFLYFDPNEHKDLIVAKVEEATGRDFEIDGDIGLTLFPRLGVAIEGVKLGNAPGFGEAPFARVDEADVSVQVLPLLTKRQLEVGTLTLRGVDIHLAKDADGRTNWDDLAAGAGEDPGEQAPSKAEAGKGLEGLAVDGVTLEDANVVWDDRSTGQHYELRDLTLHTSAITPGEPVDLDLALGLHAAEPALEGRLDLKTRVHTDLVGKRYRLEGTRLQLVASGDDLPAGKVELSAAAEVVVDLEQETLDLSGLLVKVLGLELSGAVQGTGIVQSPAFTGTLQVAPFNPKDLLAGLGQEPPATTDSKALTRVALVLALEATQNSAELSNIDLTLDESKLTGRASVRDFDQPRIGFDLHLDRIDLDAYLPPPSSAEAEAAPKASPESEPAQAPDSPLETLRSLNLDGSLAIGALKVANLRTTDILVKVKAADGVLEVKPANAQLYEGQFNGGAKLDARGEMLKTQLQWKLSGIQSGPLLADLTGKDTLHGSGNVHGDLAMSGETAQAVRNSLGGKAGFSFTNGTYKGINLAYEIRKAKALLTGGQPPPEEPAQTDFSELRANFAIDRGVVHNDDLLAKTPLLRITGEGKVDLPAEQVDYRVDALITTTLKGQGGKELDDLAGITVPVRVTGALSDPSYGVELEQLLADQAKQKLEKKVHKKIDKAIGEDTRKQIEQVIPGLGGLFGR